MVAVKLTAGAKTEDYRPAKSAAVTSKKEHGRRAGSTMSELDDLYVAACRVAIVEGIPIGVQVRVSEEGGSSCAVVRVGCLFMWIVCPYGRPPIDIFPANVVDVFYFNSLST